MAAALAEVTAIIRDVVRDCDIELVPATRFDEADDWDSMDLISIVVEVECRFGVQFELAEIDRLVTIGDLLHMIAAKQALSVA